jgi:FAD/FMN-containing dehydrogenase/Fe-S oxidoreductase
LDEQRARIFDDLRGLVGGELHFDPLARAPYRYDAGLYEHDPLGAVAPRSVDELRAVVRYAAEQGLPLHPRGGGSGEGGGCIGPGLVLDLGRHFRRLAIQGDRVDAEAGVVLATIADQLAPLGRRLAVDAPRPEVATVGGAIGVDAAGPRALGAGPMGAQVVGLRGMTGSGDVLDFAPVARPEPGLEPAGAIEGLAHRLGVLAGWHAEALARQAHGRAALGGGYHLDALACGPRIDLPRLLAGSAGTLAIVTEATLRTEPLPAHAAAVLVPYARLVDAGEAVAPVLAMRPAACELFDSRMLILAREADPALLGAGAEAPEAALLIAFEGEADVADRARRLADRLAIATAAAGEPVEFHRRAEVERLLDLRRIADDRMTRLRGARRPLVLIDRLRVPVASLPSFLARLQGLCRRAGVAAVIDAHAGLGRVRVRPFLDLADPNDRCRVEALADEVRALALELGGVASAGRGPDQLGWRLRFQGDLMNLHREIKYAFDPRSLLNPGKVVAAEVSVAPASLRVVPGVGPVDRLVETAQAATMVLRWPERPRAEHLAACNNCGACRALEPALRMCPVFRASRDEAAAPRAKVNLLRQVASGAIDPRAWGTEQFRAHADLCVHCKLCEPECPAGVDVSSLMIEAKAAFVANHGLTPEDWLLSRIDVFSAWASRMPRLFNGLMASRLARRGLQRAFGLARHRDLPRAGRESFLRRAERLGLTRPRPHEPGPRAAYFLDIFANHFDPELAASVVAVLRHLGVNVFVPPRQRGCGMPALVSGDIDRARELVRANLRVLSESVRDGYTVVCSEPTALLMLRSEAAHLTDDLDAGLVAQNAMDVGQYVANLMSREGAPRPDGALPVRVGYHQPCHLRALGLGTPSLDLIRGIPRLDAEFVDRGCSGMAGTYGLAARNFRASLRAGRGLLRRLRDDDLTIGATECSTCRMQMEQGSAKRTVHPMKLLALAFGLDPALRRHLTEPKPRRRLSD